MQSAALSSQAILNRIDGAPLSVSEPAAPAPLAPLGPAVPLAPSVGPLSAPTGGHMVVVIGKTPDEKGYYVNDPYGSCNDNYTGPVTNGKKTVYTKAMLLQLFY